MSDSNITSGKVLFSTLICVFLLAFGACKQEQKVEDPKEAAEELNEEKFDENDAKEDDSEFLVAAAEMDIMEIELGKLAASRGTSSEIKKFGDMMVAEHSQASGELKLFAERLNVSLPTAITEKGQEHWDKLNKRSGSDFDKKYAEMMVEGHKDAISKMEKAAEKANDPGIKEWASSKLPALRSHLAHAEKLKELVK